MITLVYPYYQNPMMLRRHLKEWESYAPHVKENFRAVVVDDGSPTEPAINEMREVGFPVELYRIKENIPLNLPGARNLGMHVARDGFCLLTDCDHLLEKDAAARLMQIAHYYDSEPVFWKGGNYPRDYFTLARRWADGRPLNSHPNSYLLHRGLYWEAGGTDEDFSRYWGAGEQSFRKAIASIGHAQVLGDIYLTHFGRDDIPDASTREWGRKGSPYDYNNNPELVKKARGPAYKPVNPLRFEWERVI